VSETVTFNGKVFEIKVGPQGGTYIEVTKDTTVIDPTTKQQKQVPALVKEYVKRCADQTKPDRNDPTKTITFKGCGQWIYWNNKVKCNLDGTPHNCARTGFSAPAKVPVQQNLSASAPQPPPANNTPPVNNSSPNRNADPLGLFQANVIELSSQLSKFHLEFTGWTQNKFPSTLLELRGILEKYIDTKVAELVAKLPKKKQGAMPLEPPAQEEVPAPAKSAVKLKRGSLEPAPESEEPTEANE
jgi:hypothetical protein